MTSVTSDRRFGMNSGKAVKVPCKAATTANITLSGEQTIDGVSCVTDDRVLVKDQTVTSNNGIYIVDTGAWSRASDFDDNNDICEGTMIEVNRGTANAFTFWKLNTQSPTIGSSLTFVNYTIPSVISLVAGISSLRALTPVNGTRVYLEYHTSVAGGGAGLFRGVTGAAAGTYTHNNATVVVPSGGDGSAAWLLIHEGTVTIRQAGALLDGSTDDTTALTTLLAAGITSIDLTTGTTVFGSVTSQWTDNVEVFGHGWASVIKMKSSLSTELFNPSSKTGVKFKNFKIAGNSAGQVATVNSIKLTSCTKCVIEDIWCDDIAGNGVVLVSSSKNTINDFIYTGIAYSGGGIGLALGTGGAIGGTPSDENTVNNCYIYNTKDDGIYIDLNSKKNVINNPIVESCGRYGIIMDQSGWNTINDPVIVSPTSVGIYFANSTSDGRGDHNTVNNPQIYNPAYFAIQIATTAGPGLRNIRGSTITNPQIYNGSDIGISIDNGDFTTITGGNLDTIAKQGIHVQNSSYCQIKTTLRDCGTLTNNTYASVELSNGATYNSVTISADTTATNKARSHVEETGTADYNLIEGGSATNAVTRQIIKSGANSRVSNVVGYKTKSSGTSSVQNASNIAHGLALTPTSYRLTATAAKRCMAVTGVDAINLAIAMHDDTGAAIAVNENVQWAAACDGEVV